MNHTTGVILGIRPGLASELALLSYNAKIASPLHPEIGYGLRGWVITNMSPSNLRSWIAQLAQDHDGHVMLAIDAPALPSRHADALISQAHGCGVPVIGRSSLDVDNFASDRRIRAAHLHQVIKSRPLVRLATNQALYAATHDWGWPDPLPAPVA